MIDEAHRIGVQLFDRALMLTRLVGLDPRDRCQFDGIGIELARPFGDVNWGSTVRRVCRVRRGENMGHFSMEESASAGSDLNGKSAARQSHAPLAPVVAMQA